MKSIYQSLGESLIWKWVVGQEGLFEISDIGEVRSYKGIGRIPKQMASHHPIKPCKDGRGYFNFTIREGGRNKVLPIHIEVAKAFILNPNNYKLVRHLNDDKEDNRVSNLAWGTHSDNMKDAIRNGKNPTKNNFGEGLILFLYSSERSCKSLAARYSVSPSMISKIKNGRSYGHLTGHNKVS